MAFGTGNPFHLEAESNVVYDLSPWEKRVMLKYQPPFRMRTLERLCVDLDAPAAGLEMAGKGSEQGGLPATGWPQEETNSPGWTEIDIFCTASNACLP